MEKRLTPDDTHFQLDIIWHSYYFNPNTSTQLKQKNKGSKCEKDSNFDLHGDYQHDHFKFEVRFTSVPIPTQYSFLKQTNSMQHPKKKKVQMGRKN